MGKLKSSFKRIFPAVLIFALALTLITATEMAVQYLLADDMVTAAGPSIFTNANNSFRLLFYIIEALFLSSFYAGFYRYCFSRINGEEYPVSTIFDFYRDKSKFLKSIAANNFVFIPVFISMMIVVPIMAIAAYFISPGHIASIGNYLLYFIAVILILLAVAELFFLTPFAYAKAPDDGVIMAVKRSVKLCKKVIIGLMALRFAETALLYAFVNFYISTIMDSIYTIPVFPIILEIAILTLIVAFARWLDITIAHSLLNREPIIVLENTGSDELTDDEEDEPFIKPYDFYIEEDNRYNDEKTFTTENIRETDILKVLDEMDLAYDVKNYLSVRKKLKRLFEDLAFDISEYVSYEGGRSTEGSVFDEVDDIELEITVQISKQGDHLPFVVTLKINES